MLLVILSLLCERPTARLGSQSEERYLRSADLGSRLWSGDRLAGTGLTSVEWLGQKISASERRPISSTRYRLIGAIARQRATDSIWRGASDRRSCCWRRRERGRCGARSDRARRSDGASPCRKPTGDPPLPDCDDVLQQSTVSALSCCLHVGAGSTDHLCCLHERRSATWL